jgi:acetyltransferase
VQTFQLRSGKEVTIRPIRPDDGRRLQDAYDALSPESKYRRFLAAKPHLTSADTRYLVNVDGRDHVALVAIASDNPEQFLGVARFVRVEHDSELGELAIVVADALQRQGLGSELLSRLAQEAQAVGVRRFRGTMLAENYAAHSLVRSAAGGEIRERPRGIVHEIEVELSSESSESPREGAA